MPECAPQPDLFDKPTPGAAAPAEPLRPPYTLAELTELDRQMRQFERLPDEWCPGFGEMYARAHDTVHQLPRDQRAPFRPVFFDEAYRLLQAEYAAEREAEAAAAAAAPRKTKRAASG